jgi:hypothetical protein
VKKDHALERAIAEPYTSQEYLKELVEEVIDVAVDYGTSKTPANELALAEASELLYQAIETYTKETNADRNRNS